MEGCGGRDREAAALDFIGRISGLEFSEQQFLDDLLEPQLETRVLGDLMLVAENLTESSALHFVEVLAELRIPSVFPEDAHRALVFVASTLGVDASHINPV